MGRTPAADVASSSGSHRLNKHGGSPRSPQAGVCHAVDGCCSLQRTSISSGVRPAWSWVQSEMYRPPNASLQLELLGNCFLCALAGRPLCVWPSALANDKIFSIKDRSQSEKTILTHGPLYCTHGPHRPPILHPCPPIWGISMGAVWVPHTLQPPNMTQYAPHTTSGHPYR